MKNLLLVLAMCLSSQGIKLYAQTTLIPDSRFEQALVDQGIDTDSLVNGEVLTEDLQSVKELNLFNLGIEDLSGIASFDSLERLNCANNLLEQLDLHQNSVLTELNCASNRLDSLDLGGNLLLEQLRCGNNELQVLYIQENSSLKRLEVPDNQLAELLLPPNDSLETLNCTNNQLRQLELSQSPLLKELLCASNTFTELTVSQNIRLQTLLCASNQIVSLDLTQNDSLVVLDCSENQLVSLNVDNNRLLENLTVSANQLEELTISQNDSLRLLGCANNLLNELDIRNNLFLVNLICAANQLSRLETNMISHLKSLDCADNLIRSLNLSENDSLTSLNCSQNRLEYLNLQNGNHKKLNLLNATGNSQLICIRVDEPENPGNSWFKDPEASYEIDCDPIQTYIPDNHFEQALIDLGLDSGALDSLVVTDSISSLISLDIAGDSISDLTGIQDFGELQILHCSNNLLAQLDLISNIALTDLNCSNNFLTSLILKNGNNEGLESLDARFNPNLACITIDDEAQINGNWLKDDAATYAENCRPGQTFIPDDNFEQALIDMGLDSGPLNNYVFTDSISSLTNLDVSTRKIQDLRGIEDFAGLESLDCSENDLTELDVRQNLVLKTLTCFSNFLSQLDLANNDSLLALNCGANLFREMDLSQNTALHTLRFDSNFLPAIDLSANEALEILDCSSNALVDSGLALRELPNLEQLFCNNNNLGTIDISQNTLLTRLDCGDNTLGSLNLMANRFLTRLDCSQNLLSQLDLSGNSTLDTLFCNSNQLTSLSLLSNPLLRFLQAENNQLVDIDLSNNSILGTLFLSSNQFTSVDVSPLDSLQVFHCNNNQLSSLELSQNSVLWELSCKSNQLVDLNLQGNPGLIALFSDNNRIAEIDLSQNAALRVLSISHDSLRSLSLRGNPLLDSLNCANNQLDSLDLSIPTGLSALVCSNNRLKELSLEALQGITFLNCDGNDLRALMLGNNPLLSQLSCAGNELLTLDLSFQAHLRSLNTSSNQLIELNLKNNSDTLATMNSVSNPHLSCIEVDNLLAVGESWEKDSLSKYSENCHYRETFVPDDNFERALANNTGELDDNDDYILTASIDTLKNLNLRDQEIGDLTGIQALSSLHTLDASYNLLDSLDLGTNTQLLAVDLSHNSLRSLSFANATQLRTVNLSGNQLQTLILDSLPSLVFMRCDSNDLRELDFRKNELLESLNCAMNKLESLRIANGNNTDLVDFDATENPKLLCVEVDNVDQIPDNWAIDSVAEYSENCHYNETYVPDDAFEQALINLGYDYLFAGPLDDYIPTPNIQSISSLDISGAGISDPTGLEAFISLENLNCSFNQLIELDLWASPKIRTLNCAQNLLNSLSLENLDSLTQLNASSNRLEALDVRENQKLIVMEAQNNHLFSVDANNGANDKLRHFDLRDNPNLTCILVDDVRAAPGYPNWFKDPNASYKEVCDDDDNDGIADESDSCPNTPFGNAVDLFGCTFFRIPTDNFELVLTGESCNNSDNGIIGIRAKEIHSYSVNLVGEEEERVRNFTDSLEIRNLRAGTYRLCITIENQPSFQQCFSLVITEPEALEVYRVNKVDTVEFFLSGSSTYQVSLNGESFTTSQSKIALALTPGENTVEIKTPLACQGTYFEKIFWSNEISLFPNPLQEVLIIRMEAPQPVKARVEIYSVDGKLLFLQEKEIVQRELQISLPELPKGLYTVHINTPFKQRYFKVLKK